MSEVKWHKARRHEGVRAYAQKRADKDRREKRDGDVGLASELSFGRDAYLFVQFFDISLVHG